MEVEVCYGVGLTNFTRGGDSATHEVVLAFHGPSRDNALVAFEPAQLPSSTGVAVATGTWLDGPFPGSSIEQIWGGFERFAYQTYGYNPQGRCTPELTDPPQPGEACYHETFGALYFAPPDGERLGCVEASALCGPGRQICNTITARFLEPPDAMRVFGLEGAGDLMSGCTPNPDVYVVFTGDSDRDGRYDGSDICDGYPDDDDADLDGVPDGCDDDFAVVANGTECVTDDECTSGHCTEGVCCESACGFPCESCTLPGEEGECLAFAGPADPAEPCTFGDVCTGVDSFQCGSDHDGDGVADVNDRCGGADDNLDADHDTAPDACDVCPSDADDDADGDGVCGGADVCPGADDLVDEDADGVPSGCDACPLDAFNDSDGDGSCDSDDACPLDAEDDADADGICGDLEPGCTADPDNDADADGVCAPTDACPLDPANDADGDGLCADVDTWDTCDDRQDGDADGTPDACDLCPRDAFNDSDGDGACDSDDACPLDPGDDSDADGTCDSDDACASDPLDDADGDGICGDVDPCPSTAANDADGDGICEGVDNCPGVTNADQTDTDGDAIGNACEPDGDGDGVVDDVDNCAMLANPDQADADADGEGDACDVLDLDHDGIGDASDACPNTAYAAPVDLGGCAIAQSCPPTASWKNHGAYVSCVSNAATELLLLGRIAPADAWATVSAAARSTVGKRK